MTLRKSCREWLAEQGFDTGGISDRILDEAGNPPADSGVYRMMPLPSQIVVHHSATASGSARLFRCLHRAVNGWADVGYHYVIGNGTDSGDGEVEAGRPAGVRGAHARGSNHCSLGVCLVGNFEETFPTAAQLRVLGELLRDLMLRYGLGPEDILLHRAVKGCDTVCPGRHLTLGAVLESTGGSAT
jgi:N-acetyl-anhydromuramyl-L-alanine amidase AmpD